MKTLLFLASTWPEPASSAAGTRSLQLLSLFREWGWQIQLMCAATKRPHSAPLPADVLTSPLLLNDSRMDRIFNDLQPDIVIFDRFMLEEQYGWRIAKACPQALRILDTVDLHSLRKIRRKALTQNRPPAFEDWFSDLALRELAALYRSDLSLIISDAEYHILTNELRLPASLLIMLPFLLSKSEISLPLHSPGFSERHDFISIGNFRHPPNADSVRYLHKTLWPMLRKRCPEARIKVYGADLTPDIQALHRPENGFLICGRAEDALTVMRQARVCLAPLRYGAGLKGKLLDAMLAGTPSVTTSIGAEGMQGSFPWPGAVTDQPEAWVEAAATLYQQPAEWETARHQIPALLSGRFDRQRFIGDLKIRLEKLQSTPEYTVDRLMGALLRHHQHRSTEYMSRWIEAKNQLPPQS